MAPTLLSLSPPLKSPPFSYTLLHPPPLILPLGPHDGVVVRDYPDVPLF